MGLFALPDRLAISIGVLKTHLLQFTASVELIMASVCLLSEIFHVHADQHLTQLHKVTMVFILH